MFEQGNSDLSWISSNGSWFNCHLWKGACQFLAFGSAFSIKFTHSLDSCLVLLCDQNSFGLTKLIWTWPLWFGHDQNEMAKTKMNWSGPNCDFLPKWITVWTWPIHFGLGHFILVVTNSLWSSSNQFGQTKTILDRPKLSWSQEDKASELSP